MPSKISNPFKRLLLIKRFLLNLKQLSLARFFKENFNEIPVDGDGNCFYYAALFYLKNQYENQQQLRDAVADYLSKESWWCEFSPCSIDAYIQGVRNRKWADQIVIEALSRLLERPIIIIGPDGKVRNKPYLKFLDNDPIFVCFNGQDKGNVDQGHYNALDFVSKKHTKKFVMYKLLDGIGYFENEKVDVSSDSFGWVISKKLQEFYNSPQKSSISESELVKQAKISFDKVFATKLQELYDQYQDETIPEAELVEQARLSAIVHQVNELNKVNEANKLLDLKLVFEKELQELRNNPKNELVPEPNLVKHAMVSTYNVLVSKELQKLYDDPKNKSVSDDSLVNEARETVIRLIKKLKLYADRDFNSKGDISSSVKVKGFSNFFENTCKGSQINSQLAFSTSQPLMGH
jgi:OTU-like cysteine protease